MTHSCEDCIHSTLKGFFYGLDHSLINDLNKNKRIQKYKKNQYVYTEGSALLGLHCINQGKVKIVKENHEGKESILRLAGFGDTLGHYTLVHTDTYTNSAVAIEDSKVCFLHKDFLTEMLKKHPSIAVAFINKMSSEMNQADLKISSLVQKNVRERLADLLLSLSETFGVEEDGLIRFNIKLTRDEIGSLIGTVNETVTRFISEFKDEGLIEERGKTIYILDLERLKKFSNQL